MKIVFHKKFTKRFDVLPKKIQEQFYERLTIFGISQFHPLLNNHILHHPYEGCRSINVNSNLRALFETISDTITFIRIDTHSNLYK